MSPLEQVAHLLTTVATVAIELSVFVIVMLDAQTVLPHFLGQ